MEKPPDCGLLPQPVKCGRTRASVSHPCIDPARLCAELYVSISRLSPFLLQLARHDVMISILALGFALSQTQLPALMNFIAFMNNSPSKLDLASFWASVQTSNAGHAINNLALYQKSSLPRNVVGWEGHLCSQDLQPCMALGNLRQLEA